MTRNDLQNFLGKNYLNFQDESLNNLIPKLLMRKENYNGNPISKEVFVMLLAYKLRNFGGHEIEQQYILTKEYDNIITNFMYALFFAIQKLN